MWILLLLALSIQAPRAGWVDVGLEGPNRVAVELQSIPDRPQEPFSASLAVVPPGWPGRSYEYETWLVTYDCQARSRQVRTTFRFSSKRDPVRTLLSGPSIRESDSPAIRRQLAVVCAREEVGEGRAMSLSDFVERR